MPGKRAKRNTPVAFVVEWIRPTSNDDEMLVKWQGFPLSEATIEPDSNLRADLAGLYASLREKGEKTLPSAPLPSSYELQNSYEFEMLAPAEPPAELPTELPVEPAIGNSSPPISLSPPPPSTLISCEIRSTLPPPRFLPATGLLSLPLAVFSLIGSFLPSLGHSLRTVNSSLYQTGVFKDPLTGQLGTFGTLKCGYGPNKVTSGEMILQLKEAVKGWLPSLELVAANWGAQFYGITLADLKVRMDAKNETEGEPRRGMMDCYIIQKYIEDRKEQMNIDLSTVLLEVQALGGDTRFNTLNAVLYGYTATEGNKEGLAELSWLLGNYFGSGGEEAEGEVGALLVPSITITSHDRWVQRTFECSDRAQGYKFAMVNSGVISDFFV